jgi:hypothetical protein
MRGTNCCAALGAAGLALVLLAAPGGAQEKKETVYRGVSPDVLEKILEGAGIRFKKTAGKGGTTIYDYERGNYKIRLANEGSKYLWIDAAFPRAALTQINAWNVNAKFSRAVLRTEGGSEASLVEAQLDCTPGVTEGIIRQFLTRFEGEVRDFDRFISR